MCSSACLPAEGIYNVLDAKLLELLECAKPWSKCTSVGIDKILVLAIHLRP